MAGLATHYCEYNRLGELEAGLLTCTNASQVEEVLSKFCREEKPTKSSLEKLLGNINKSFSGKSVEDIFENLERDNSDWSQVQLKVVIKNTNLNIILFNCMDIHISIFGLFPRWALR